MSLYYLLYLCFFHIILCVSIQYDFYLFSLSLLFHYILIFIHIFFIFLPSFSPSLITLSVYLPLSLSLFSQTVFLPLSPLSFSRSFCLSEPISVSLSLLYFFFSFHIYLFINTIPLFPLHLYLFICV